MYSITFNRTIWEFPVAPDSLEVSYPTRTHATPTFTRAYVDHFGPGIGQINLSATTGWGVGERKNRPNGVAAMIALINLHQRYLLDAAASPDPEKIPMFFTDSMLKRVFRVMPDQSGLRVSQQRGSPLLPRFSYTLTVLEDLSGGQSQSLVIGKLFATKNPVIQPQNFLAGRDNAANAIGAIRPTSSRYEVQDGDTLQSIATAFKVDPQVLASSNGLRSTRLQAGLIITIPGQ